MPVAHVPGVVHVDLVQNDKIPDPIIGLKELDMEGIGEKTWTYRTTIKRPSNSETAKAVLIFEGLDTLATVKLNGEIILESDNMFLEYRFDISSLLAPSKEAVLEIDFDSALLRGCELFKAHPEHKFIACSVEDSRLTIRKVQYHWDWDWGPILMTAGPWRPIRLELHHARL